MSGWLGAPVMDARRTRAVVRSQPPFRRTWPTGPSKPTGRKPTMSKSTVQDPPAAAPAVVFDQRKAEEAGQVIARTLGVTKDLKALAPEIDAIVARAEKFVCDSPAALANGDALRGEINSIISRGEALREQYAKPWYRFWKLVQGLFAADLLRLETSKKRVSRLMRDQHDRQEAALLEEARKRDERNRRIQERQAKAAEKKGTPPPPPPAKTEVSMPKSVGGTQFAKSWSFRIQNEAEIPRQYLMVDTAKIRQMVRGGARNPDIPGVDIFEDKQVRGG